MLARTTCHRGSRRLHPGRSGGQLYFARGLFESGHGESVLAFRSTTISSVRKLAELAELLQRNANPQITLDHLLLELRRVS